MFKRDVALAAFRMTLALRNQRRSACWVGVSAI